MQGKSKCSPNLTTKNSKFKIFVSPKLAPERPWGTAGQVGRAETCFKPREPTPRRPLPPHAWRCGTVSGFAMEWRGQTKTDYEIFEIEKNSNSQILGFPQFGSHEIFRDREIFLIINAHNEKQNSRYRSENWCVNHS